MISIKVSPNYFREKKMGRFIEASMSCSWADGKALAKILILQARHFFICLFWHKLNSPGYSQK